MQIDVFWDVFQEYAMAWRLHSDREVNIIT